MSGVSKVNNLLRLDLAAEAEATPQNTLGCSATLRGCLCMAVVFFFSPKENQMFPVRPSCNSAVVTGAFREHCFILHYGECVSARPFGPLKKKEWQEKPHLTARRRRSV